MRSSTLFLLLPLFYALLLHPSNAHNITRILADHPEFSTFNHYLTITHLASEINRRLTITVLAVDNSGMSSILSHHYSLPTLKNILSLHILVDYYGAKKLHQITSGTALSSSFFQSTGAAPGTTGFVNITDHAKGHVTFSAEDSTNSPSSFVKAVKEIPYNISVIQISAPLSSPDAEAPASAPAPVNLTATLRKGGCKAFADLISADAEVLKAFEDNMDGGLTVFCPIDSAINAFLPKFKNLTAAHKTSLLLYHGEAVYNSIQMLKANNGLINTLATEGTKKNYNYVIQNDGDVVTVKTKVTTATIGKTLVDQDPVAIYTVDKVLEPKELFKAAPADADAPAPAADAPAAPKKGKKKGKKEEPAADAPADGPGSAPADEKTADDNAAGVVGNGRWAAVAVAVVVAVVGVMV